MKYKLEGIKNRQHADRQGSRVGIKTSRIKSYLLSYINN